jgi:STE24 endopeptidase
MHLRIRARLRALAAILLFAALTSVHLNAQPAAQITADITKAPLAAQPSPNFNADAATEAYMAMIPAAAMARSNAYFEGGYWLILWSFLYGSAIGLIVLQLRWSARMRDLSERITRFKWLQTFLYWVQYTLVTTLLGFPLEVYQNYIREHQYGLATQTFGPWMGDELKSLLIGLLLGGIAVSTLLAIVRKLPRSWWIWGALAALGMVTIAVAIGPVYLQPLFNKVTRLDDPKVTGPILKMAHANGIPSNDVYEIDASRQSNRVSANVSGFANTMRITLNDNLLKRASPEEIQAVMGHEMGHYVLNHISKDIFFMFVLITGSFAFLRWSLAWSLTRWGARWQIRDISDPAVLPLAFLLIGILFFVLTPILNTHVRTEEKEADMFGLNASRQPDGTAQAAIQLSDYRKMHPTRLEEIIFFDHPSGYNRIHSAMVWKGQNQELFEK